MTYAALQAELYTGPRAHRYAEALERGDDNAVAELVNEPMFSGPVPINELSRLCVERGIWGAVEAAAHDQTFPFALRAAAFNALAIMRNDGRLQTADVESSRAGAMLNGFLAAGLITEADRAAVLALAQDRYSAAQYLWGPTSFVSAFDVGSARKRN